MTDNEIIKALEWHSNDEEHCSPCPYEEHSVTHYCLDMLLDDARSLVARQKEEIERLKNRDLQVEVSEKLERKIKAEAVKDFAEKFEMAFFIKQDEQREQMLDILKSHRATLSYSDVEQATDNWLRGYGESVQDVIGILDNLLKETAGETE